MSTLSLPGNSQTVRGTKRVDLEQTPDVTDFVSSRPGSDGGVRSKEVLDGREVVEEMFFEVLLVLEVFIPSDREGHSLCPLFVKVMNVSQTMHSRHKVVHQTALL